MPDAGPSRRWDPRAGAAQGEQTEAAHDRADPDLHSDGSERALILLQPNVTNPSQALARDIEHLGVKDITTKKQRGAGSVSPVVLNPTGATRDAFRQPSAPATRG